MTTADSRRRMAWLSDRDRYFYIQAGIALWSGVGGLGAAIIAVAFRNDLSAILSAAVIAPIFALVFPSVILTGATVDRVPSIRVNRMLTAWLSRVRGASIAVCSLVVSAAVGGLAGAILTDPSHPALFVAKEVIALLVGVLVIGIGLATLICSIVAAVDLARAGLHRRRTGIKRYFQKKRFRHPARLADLVSSLATPESALLVGLTMFSLIIFAGEIALRALQ